jgi:hypothetical protein
MASIDPNLWGRPFWSTLHWTAAGYPAVPSAEDKVAYKTFFETLQLTLPCISCRKHFSDLLLEMPIDPFLTSGKQLRQWVCSLHNAINSRTDSSERWTIIQVDAAYPPADKQDTVGEEQEQQPQHEQPLSSIILPSRPPQIITAVQIERLRKQQHQMVIQNNARSMGRVLKPAVSVRRVVQRPPVMAPAPSQNTSTLTSVTGTKPKKKGCGCNKKK